MWLPLQMFLTKEGIRLKHPMRWHKVMSLMHCLVCDECIHIYFPWRYSNHCLSQNLVWWRKYFVSLAQLNISCHWPHPVDRWTAAVVFVPHGDWQRYRDSPFHFFSIYVVSSHILVIGVCMCEACAIKGSIPKTLTHSLDSFKEIGNWNLRSWRPLSAWTKSTDCFAGGVETTAVD